MSFPVSWMQVNITDILLTWYEMNENKATLASYSLTAALLNFWVMTCLLFTC